MSKADLRFEGVPCSSGYTLLNDQPYLEHTFSSRNFRQMYPEETLDFDGIWGRNQCPENDRLMMDGVWRIRDRHHFMVMSTVSIKAFILLAALLFAPVTTGYAQPAGVTSEIAHIEPSNETGTSKAVAVGDAPLVFTDQFFPFDSSGSLVGASDVERQIEQVLSHIEAALDAAGTDLEGLVRLHVYLADDSLSEKVLKQLAAVLPGQARPAITFVSGTPVRSGALVSMDAVAAAPDASVKGRTSLYRAEGGYGPETRAHAAVLSPGRKLFISGQAARADDLPAATRATMRGLLATLAYAGASAADIVHVKAFINPAEDAEAVEEEIASFFRHQAPPVVTLEWQHESLPTEIELVASAPDDPRAEEAVSYYAPPWMDQATTFSRLVDVRRGRLLFTSSLYGEPGQEGEAQARAVFNALSRVLEEGGSDYDHLVKGTYYPASDEARDGFTAVRPDFYNPERPPAASLAEVEGAGRPERTLTVDMIGVIPR